MINKIHAPSPGNGISVCGVRLNFRMVIALVLLFSFIITYFKFQNSPSFEVATSSEQVVDAVVFIAMSSLAKDYMVDYSVSSIRLIGGWKGDIYIVTDSVNCYGELARDHNVKLIQVKKSDSIIEIKALKARLFEELPDEVKKILYLDVDVVAKQNLASFFHDIRISLAKNEIKFNKEQSLLVSPSIDRSHESSASSGEGNNPKSPASFDFAAFPDARGHFVGFCSGCEKWHTGVMYFTRPSVGSNNICLQAWLKILLSGKYGTDQQSLDEAEKLGYCPHAVELPSQHLLFAKDYLGMLFAASTQSFIHMTSAARLENEDILYRKYIVPNLRSKLSPPLNNALLESGLKRCT